jgi:hypothetical protein
LIPGFHPGLQSNPPSGRDGSLEVDLLQVSEALDEGEGLVQFREEGFVGFEFAGMDAAAEATHLYRMLEVKHLVVEQILDGVARA